MLSSNQIQIENTQSLSFESSGFDDLLSSLPNDLMLYLLGIYLANIEDLINLAKTSMNRYRFHQQNQEQVLVNNLLTQAVSGKLEAARKIWARSPLLLSTSLANIVHAKTSTNCSRIHQQNQEKILLNNKLLTHAVFGEWRAAREIWTKYPDILKLKGSVKRCYEYNDHTAYQIAWRNEEDDIIAEMNKFLSYEEQKKQFDEIFPDGKLIKHNWSFDKAIQLLQALCDAVIKDTVICENDMSLMNDETRIALQALCDYLNPDKSGQCKTGLVCDVTIYLQASNFYQDKIVPLRERNRRTFWCIRVQEMIATFLSTGYLRAHCQGIYSIVTGSDAYECWGLGGRKVNDAGCILSNGLSYFRCTEGFRPGFNFCVDVSGYVSSPFDTRGNYLLTFMCNKNLKLEDLSARAREHVASTRERVPLRLTKVKQD
jgi:hypothetical protein